MPAISWPSRIALPWRVQQRNRTFLLGSPIYKLTGDKSTVHLQFLNIYIRIITRCRSDFLLDSPSRRLQDTIEEGILASLPPRLLFTSGLP